MLTIQEIIDNAGNPDVFIRGKNIYRLWDRYAFRSLTEDLEDGMQSCNARIRSTNGVYTTQLLLLCADDDTQILDYSCTCPAYEKYAGMCKHCVALALYYRDQQAKSLEEAHNERVPKSITTSPLLTSLMQTYNAMSRNAQIGLPRGSVRINPFLQRDMSYYSGVRWSLSLEIGTNRMYVVKSQTALLRNVLTGAFFSYGKQLAFHHTREIFDEQSQKLLSIIQPVIRAATPYLEFSSISRADRTIGIGPEILENILSLYQGDQIRINGDFYPVIEADPNAPLKMEPEGESAAKLIVPQIMELANRFWLLEKTVYHVSQAFQMNAAPFLIGVRANENSRGTTTLHLNEADYRSFCGNLLPVLSAHFAFTADTLDLSAYQPQKPEFSFYLSMNDDLSLSLRPLVHYGGAEYPLYHITVGEYRMPELEQPVRELIDRYFTDNQCANEDQIYEFLCEGIDDLRKHGTVFVADSAKKAQVRSSPSAKVRISLSGGLIDLDAHVDGLDEAEMLRILNAYAKKKRYYRLGNGEFLSLESGTLSVLSDLVQVCQLPDKALSHVAIPAFRAQYLNELLTASDSGIEVERTTDFKALVRHVRDYRDSDDAVPAQLCATLRRYQKTGFRWMSALAQCGLCGILADDMGLGKTIQTIAFLLHLRKNALIVCPASLVYNWAAELERFAPTLCVKCLVGTAGERKKALHEEADVYVTSYDLLRRDIENYAETTFGCCVIDEAQYVRNAGTKVAHAVKQIHAEHRFALTGTPIFNRLADLWSIFDFLLPGYLYTEQKFRKEIEIPILRGEEVVSHRLQRMTAPFILRRKKEDVLQELPEKIENIQYVEMTREQRLLYLAQEEQLRRSLQGMDEQDFRNSRMEYLAALTRLRQLCCTPELYLEGYKGGSGKVDACMELLGEAVSGGHRVLVFSQFTTMLDALYDAAQKRGISCLMLTGKHTKEQRRDMVTRFQNQSIHVFFISLKAGGTGLNLTAADRIIHFDPWWNAAAEDQATDRAHRIGQDHTVFVTKLVTKDTVEERIIRLQEKKRQLSDAVIEQPEASSGALQKDALLALLGASEKEV